MRNPPSLAEDVVLVKPVVHAMVQNPEGVEPLVVAEVEFELELLEEPFVDAWPVVE